MESVGWVFVGGGCVLIVAALTGWARRELRRRRRENPVGLVDVGFAGESIVITPRGAWKVFGVRSRVTIPVTHVRGCVAEPFARDNHQLDLRLGGTGVPGLVLAGTMRGPEGLSYWAYGAGANAIVFDLREDRFAYLVVEVDDPDSTVAAVNEFLRTSSIGPAAS